MLHRLGVTTAEGDALFTTSTFGMPLELALSLLTDLHGNIVLDLPIAGDEAGMRTGLSTLIGNAFTRAILNAVTSPLKLIGAVARIGEKPAAVAPGTLAFLAGRPELAEGERAKLDALAGLLGRAPGLRLHLRGEAGDANRRLAPGAGAPREARGRERLLRELPPPRRARRPEGRAVARTGQTPGSGRDRGARAVAGPRLARLPAFCFSLDRSSPRPRPARFRPARAGLLRAGVRAHLRPMRDAPRLRLRAASVTRGRQDGEVQR